MPHHGFEELFFNQGYFKAFSLFLVFILPLRKTHLGPLLLAFQQAVEMGWPQYVQLIKYIHTLPYIFTSVLRFFIQNINKKYGHAHGMKGTRVQL